jgi:pilus assembly protein CpaB
MPKINKNWLILVAALTVGAFAAFSTKSYIKSKVDDIESQTKSKAMVKVVVANKALEKGVQLSAENMATREIPQEWMHSGAITPDQFDRAHGATLAFPAGAGEPVLWAQLETQNTTTFSAKLDAGRRAVTVPVDEISSISGMLEPEDLIDIVVSMQKDNHSLTFTLLQSVRVLATGSKVSQHQRDDGGQPVTYTTVTLDTSPEDAKRLIAAREAGRVTALLRAPGDVSDISSRRSSVEDLLGMGAKETYGLSSVPVIYGGGPIKEALRMNLSQAPEEGPAAADSHSAAANTTQAP